MKMVRITVAAALSTVAFAPAAYACEFDGLPGMHRFNPFLHDAKKNWPKAPPVAPIVRPESERAQDSEMVLEDGTKTKVSEVTNTRDEQAVSQDKAKDKETAT